MGFHGTEIAERTDRAPWEWVGGYFPNEALARNAYNRLYPEGERSGVVGRIVPVDLPGVGQGFELQLTSWPAASRELDERNA
jgi:hypothetical protein